MLLLQRISDLCYTEEILCEIQTLAWLVLVSGENSYSFPLMINL